MRMRSLHIGSFGKMRDKDFQLAPGLTVFYGPNESGKSTTMEFIRSTLSPSRKSSYPQRSSTDSGTIVYEEEGSEKRVMMEGKTGNAGDVPRCMADMDPGTYRNIFAMTREGLDEITPLTGGDIRTRFLTIPGGESVPEVIKSIDEDKDRLIGKTASSPSKINAIVSDEVDLQRRIYEMRSHAETYSELSTRKDELERRLSEIRDSNRSAKSNNDLYVRVESQKAAFSELAELRKSKLELSSKHMADKDVQETYRRLSSEKSEAEAAYKAVNEGRRMQVSSLPGGDESKLLGYRPRIQSILDRQSRYQSEIAKPQSRTVQNSNGKVRIGVAAILLAMAAATWIVPGLDTMVKAGVSAVLAVGAVSAFLLIKDKQVYENNRDENWIHSFESELHSVMTDVGVAPGDPLSDLRRLSEINNTLTNLDSTRNSSTELRMSFMGADNRLMGFLAQYGGPEGYQQAVRDYETFTGYGAKIEALEGSIRKSGFDPDEPLPIVERIDIDTTEQDAISNEIGRLTEEMKTVLDTKELDSLIDQTYSLSAQKNKVLTEGAKAILESAIIQKACSDIYETVHPDVISTADRYLSMMTLGTCHFDLDPRNTDLTVISKGEPKNPKQWSTGLRAQILLSIKLAVAKEMGSGEIPVILDDVLLPFDKDRKNGACQALSMLSNEMQVLLFTCDEDVEEMCKGLANVSIITI